ncbi:MAG TPA: YkgJ family cysteine cluster protein [Pseudomonadota bacterium]|jgi:Fe-S-cluster containining protein|nr:YkgJ family cysteine cluster protein [Pseudomonadota bacterium]HND09443.1 YkgJ family cysteine cluster protein [Pseudomonadota bacterium]HNF99325.1 YkgJ family cysteine cluster protein [Pseudomonadota bacterium]HNK43391.1 YkgJ family cysteine cluster protein [Pseudomonadota bacterium]HNN51241.1 YkgJ family cysteine cluster protein [Pseudomonadota bacterium]
METPSGFAKTARVELDCQRCGACCVNAKENEAEGRTDYVSVEPSAKLLLRRDLVRKYVVMDDMGHPHLRLASDGRCLALRGVLFKKVSCELYHHRPKACRTVQPGDGDCLRARKERGMTDDDR